MDPEGCDRFPSITEKCKQNFLDMSSGLKMMIHSGGYPSYQIQPTGYLSGKAGDAAKMKMIENSKEEPASHDKAGS